MISSRVECRVKNEKLGDRNSVEKSVTLKEKWEGNLIHGSEKVFKKK